MEEERPPDRDDGDPQPPAVADEVAGNTGNTVMEDERINSAVGGAGEMGQGHQEEDGGSPSHAALVPDAADHNTGISSSESIRRAFMHLSLYRREFPSSALEEHEDAFRGEILREVFDAFALSGGTLPPECNHLVTPRLRFGSMDVRSVHFLEDSCPLDLDPVVEEQFAPANELATNLLLGTWDVQEKTLEPHTQQRKRASSSEMFGLGSVPGLGMKRGRNTAFWALNLEAVWLGPRGDGKRLEVPGWSLSFQIKDAKRAAIVYLLFCAYCATLDDMCGMNPEKLWKPYQLRSLLQRGLSPQGQEKYSALASSLLDDFTFLRSIYRKGISLDWTDDALRAREKLRFRDTFEDGVLVSWMEGGSWPPWESASDYLQLRFGWEWPLADWFLKVEGWSWKYSPHDVIHKRSNGGSRGWHKGDGMSTYAPARKVCNFDLGYLVDQMMVPQGEEQAPLPSVQLFALRPTGIDGNPEYQPVDVVRVAPRLVNGVFIDSVCHHIIQHDGSFFFWGYAPLQLKSMCLTYLDEAFAHCRRVTEGVALPAGRVMCPVGPFAFINSVRSKEDPGTAGGDNIAATPDVGVGPAHQTALTPSTTGDNEDLFLDDASVQVKLRGFRKRLDEIRSKTGHKRNSSR